MRQFFTLGSVLLGDMPRPEPASPWVQYVIYGVVFAFIVFLVVKGFKQKKKPLPAPQELPKPAVDYVEKTPEEEQAEARTAFSIPEIQSGPDGYGRTRIRLADPSEALPPTSSKILESKEKSTGNAVKMEAAGKTLREGLSRTHEGFIKRLGKLFGNAQQIDDQLLGEIEEALFTADIGVKTSQKLVEELQQNAQKSDFKDPQKLWALLKSRISTLLESDPKPLDLSAHKPFVIMAVGVNGAGKTTTLGKLAYQYKSEGKRVLLAAADTFRAAAVEQLGVWAERAQVPMVRGPEKADPSSVAFEACQKAMRENYDVVIIDTAGRLQARKELMDELAKISRSAEKALPGAPHETWLVLDSTNGQNALSQAREFTAAVSVTGLVLTKLDGTAKGGVVIGICDELGLPVRYIGIGEKISDLRPFVPKEFTAALFGDI